MCRDCIGCSPDCPDRYWGITVQTSMLVRCQVCGKLNSKAKNYCKKCGTDLKEAKLKTDITKCLFTGKMCDNPCSLSKVVRENFSTAVCPRS